MSTVSVCMIIKNESKVLKDALSSIQAFADQIIIVDTGSTDNSMTIARQFTQDIYEFEWTGSFADARNYCDSLATMDYICRFDGDWVMQKNDSTKVKKLKEINFKNSDLINFTFVENFDDSNPKLIKPISKTSLFFLFRREIFHWQSPIHNELIANNPKQILNVLNVHEILVFHYRRKADKSSWRLKQTIDTLIAELNKDYSNTRLLTFLAREYFVQLDYETALPRLQDLIIRDLDIDLQSYVAEKLIFCLINLDRINEIQEYNQFLESNHPRSILIRADIACLDNAELALSLYNQYLEQKFNFEKTRFEFDFERYTVYPHIQIATILIHQNSLVDAQKHIQIAIKLTHLQTTKNQAKLLRSYC